MTKRAVFMVTVAGTNITTTLMPVLISLTVSDKVGTHSDTASLDIDDTDGRIILPQMVKRVLPSVTNEVITLVKDTSLASVIGTVEMFTRAKQIAVAPNSPGMLAFAAAAVFYFVFNSLVAFAMERIEKAFAYYR